MLVLSLQADSPTEICIREGEDGSAIVCITTEQQERKD